MSHRCRKPSNRHVALPSGRPVAPLLRALNHEHAREIRKLAQIHRHTLHRSRRTEIDRHHLGPLLPTGVPSSLTLAVERERQPVTIHVGRRRLNGQPFAAHDVRRRLARRQREDLPSRFLTQDNGVRSGGQSRGPPSPFVFAGINGDGQWTPRCQRIQRSRIRVAQTPFQDAVRLRIVATVSVDDGMPVIHTSKVGGKIGFDVPERQFHDRSSGR